MTTEQPRAHILVVDDDDMVRTAIVRYLRRTGYETAEAGDAAQALERLEERTFEAMLCDIRMPGMSGIELLPKVIAKDPDIAVVMLTAVGDPRSAIECLKVGAADYLVKPVELEELQHALQYALRKRQLEVERRELEEWLAREVAEKTRALEEQSRQVEMLSLSVLTVLVDAAEPPASGGRNHSMRVANLAAHVAAELGLPREEVENVRMAGRLHDLGRVVVRDERLHGVSGPGGGMGSADEVAARILEPLRQHAGIVETIKSQGEHWDGSGTPEQRAEEEIPIGARIVAAVNRYDELTDGAGADALEPDEAARRIRALAGSALDPDVVDALDKVLSRRR